MLIFTNEKQFCIVHSCADPENFLGVGGGRGGGVQILRRVLTENFNAAKINNLAIPGGGVRTWHWQSFVNDLIVFKNPSHLPGPRITIIP